jgi:hypothetical protein
METHDLCITILHAGASQMRLSHIVDFGLICMKHSILAPFFHFACGYMTISQNVVLNAKEDYNMM